MDPQEPNPPRDPHEIYRADGKDGCPTFRFSDPALPEWMCEAFHARIQIGLNLVRAIEQVIEEGVYVPPPCQCYQCRSTRTGDNRRPGNAHS
jgi:hypothetical protein